MRASLSDRVGRALVADRGSIAVLAGLLVALLLFGVGAAVDLIRAQDVQAMVQGAARGAARAVVRGATDTQAEAYVQTALLAHAQTTGEGGAPSAVVTVHRQEQTSVTVTVALPEGSSFSVFRAMTGNPLSVSASVTEPFPCVPPPARWTPTTQACPDGQSGMISFDQEETAVCVGAGGPVIWSATENRQNYSSTCETD